MTNDENAVTLPLTLRKNGFTYTQVCRGWRSCVYLQEVADGVDYFEVFVIRTTPAKHLPGGRVLPAKEKFPSDNDFGKYAWTYRTMPYAMRKFRELEGGGATAVELVAAA